MCSITRSSQTHLRRISSSASRVEQGCCCGSAEMFRRRPDRGNSGSRVKRVRSRLDLAHRLDGRPTREQCEALTTFWRRGSRLQKRSINKGGNWCRGRESNPHAPLGTQDFKSCASASSATPASPKQWAQNSLRPAEYSISCSLRSPRARCCRSSLRHVSRQNRIATDNGCRSPVPTKTDRVSHCKRGAAVSNVGVVLK